MNLLTIPIMLAVLGLLAGIAAHRSIKQGNARFYALERDAMMRRASFTLLASICLFVASVGLLSYNQQQMLLLDEGDSAETDPSPIEDAPPLSITLAPTAPAAVVENLPPTAAPSTAIPTIDPNIPTATPTRAIIRGVVEGTSGSGAYLREDAGTNFPDIAVLDEGTIIELIGEGIPVEANGYIWINVKTFDGKEGWVADIYLTIQDR